MSAVHGDGPEVGRTGARFGGAPRQRWGARTGVTPSVTEGPDPAPAAADAVPGEEPGAGRAGPVGLTGARFGGSARRRRRVGPATPAPSPSSARTSTEPPAEPSTGPLPVVPGPPGGGSAGPAPDEAATVPDQPHEGTGIRARPYVLTGGRTRSRLELSLETLVSVAPTATPSPASEEHRAVLAMCAQARSMAEIAALLRAPLGVARVLVGDLAGTGALVVHRTADAAGPDLALMERVLSGLRRL